MKAKIGIDEKKLAEVAYSISKILADEYLLSVKTRRAHWNVEGPDFYSKHKFFEEQYSQLEGIIDQIAERIRKLGHYPPASLKDFLALTHLTEDYRGDNDAPEYIKMLLADHESVLIHLREMLVPYETDLKDVGTNSYLSGLIETHETMAWMLRAHLS